MLFLRSSLTQVRGRGLNVTVEKNQVLCPCDHDELISEMARELNTR